MSQAHDTPAIPPSAASEAASRPGNSRPPVAIIGGGPAGLMAAEVLAAAGWPVDLYDAMPSVGRKFLMAGKSGLNITHAEELPAVDVRAVVEDPVHHDRLIQLTIRLGRAGRAGEHAGSPGHEPCLAQRRGDEGGGQIAEWSEVLAQRTPHGIDDVLGRRLQIAGIWCGGHYPSLSCRIT